MKNVDSPGPSGARPRPVRGAAPASPGRGPETDDEPPEAAAPSVAARVGGMAAGAWRDAGATAMESEEDMKAAFVDRLVGSLLPVPDVAEMLGFTRQRILQLIQQGKLTATKPGREWLVMASSVQEFMDARAAREVEA